MKKLILAIIVAFAVIGGSASLIGIGAPQAHADPGSCGGSGC
jgi:hypothetical protein